MPKKTTKNNHKKEIQNIMDEKLLKAQEMLGIEGQIPETEIKYERKEKGLYEKASKNTILITEDNKVMLND